MGIVYLLLHKGGLCHVHLAQSVQLGNVPVPEFPASFPWRKFVFLIQSNPCNL